MNNYGVLELDIHGMTRYEAKIYIDDYINQMTGEIYTLRIVHGHRGGTGLRDMVRQIYKKHPQVKRIQHSLNPGTTELILRELY